MRAAHTGCHTSSPPPFGQAEERQRNNELTNYKLINIHKKAFVSLILAVSIIQQLCLSDSQHHREMSPEHA